MQKCDMKWHWRENKKKDEFSPENSSSVRWKVGSRLEDDGKIFPEYDYISEKKIKFHIRYFVHVSYNVLYVLYCTQILSEKQ